MRKVIFQMMISIDGYFEGPNRELDWHNVDNEFNEYAIATLNKIDTLLFGRVTYQLMASYWPSAEASNDDPIIAAKMNSLAKVVFSGSLASVEWNNSRLVKDNFAGEVARLKNQPGKDMAIFGSSDLALSLIEAGLIDEFRIFISPVTLGSGKSLFQGMNHRLKLKLIESRQFNSGNVLLCYRPG